MNEIFCIKCGTPNQNSTRYCINCGADITSQQEPKSADLNRPVILNLAHLAGISDYQKGAFASGVNYSYKQHYLIQAIPITRPKEGVSKSAIYCQYCNEPFTLIVHSLESARRQNTKGRIVALIIAVAIGLLLLIGGASGGNGPAICFGIVILGIGIAWAWFGKFRDSDGISIDGIEQVAGQTTGHKLLTQREVAAMQSTKK